MQSLQNQHIVTGVLRRHLSRFEFSLIFIKKMIWIKNSDVKYVEIHQKTKKVFVNFHKRIYEFHILD